MKLLSKKFSHSAIAMAASVCVAACGGGEGVDGPPSTDGVPPVLTITDGVSAAKAVDNVTFIFSFSESVGNSFTTSDVIVAGGTPLTLIKVNDQKYLLEVVVPKDSQGVLKVAVPVGAFTDAGGTANRVASQHEQEFNTVKPVLDGDITLASFDEAPTLVFEGFNGAETSSIAAGPVGGAGKAGKIVRLGGEIWAGAKVNTGPIALSATNRIITARVHSPLAGVPMMLKLEGSSASKNTGDLRARETVQVGWQTLSWVVPADKVATDYVWVVMLPNLDTRASADPGETYYFDDIKLLAPATLTNFDEETPPLFEGFNGAETSSLAAGPAGGTGLSGRIIRLGGEIWAGAKANVGPIALSADKRTITARVHSPAAGVPMVLKLEAANPNKNTGDLRARETVIAGWQTLSWVVPADKVAPDYIWVVMLPNLDTRASVDPGETYHFDDIKLLPTLP